MEDLGSAGSTAVLWEEDLIIGFFLKDPGILWTSWSWCYVHTLTFQYLNLKKKIKTIEKIQRSFAFHFIIFLFLFSSRTLCPRDCSLCSSCEKPRGLFLKMFNQKTRLTDYGQVWLVRRSSFPWRHVTYSVVLCGRGLVCSVRKNKTNSKNLGSSTRTKRRTEPQRSLLNVCTTDTNRWREDVYRPRKRNHECGTVGQLWW